MWMSVIAREGYDSLSPRTKRPDAERLFDHFLSLTHGSSNKARISRFQDVFLKESYLPHQDELGRLSQIQNIYLAAQGASEVLADIIQRGLYLSLPGKN